LNTVGAFEASDADMSGSDAFGVADSIARLVTGLAMGAPIGRLADGFGAGDGKPGDDAIAW
ncbi:MAG: hypothetical protein ACRDU4_20775, partial [Mycobacterium sp.]